MSDLIISFRIFEWCNCNLDWCSKVHIHYKTSAEENMISVSKTNLKKRNYFTERLRVAMGPSIRQNNKDVWEVRPVPSFLCKQLLVGGHQCSVGSGGVAKTGWYFVNKIVNRIFAVELLVSKLVEYFCVPGKQNYAYMCCIWGDIYRVNNLKNETFQGVKVGLSQTPSLVHQKRHVHSFDLFTGIRSWTNKEEEENLH